MFANLFISQGVILAFAGLLIAVAISDVRSLTIPNRYCAAIVLLYPVYVLTAPYSVDWSDGAIVGVIALTIGFVLFAMRLAGAGDVKFFSAVSVWAGSHLLVEFVFTTALVGGLFALFMLIQRFLANRRTASAGGLLDKWRFGRRAKTGALAVETGPGTAAPDTAAQAHPESRSGAPQPVGTLPYGAAISFGGVAVAAMLLMRG
jgi:Flp pilus assembly protein protease CpaA